MTLSLIIITIISFALLIKGANFLFDAIKADQISTQQESQDNSRMSMFCMVIGTVVFFGGLFALLI